jgi:hypothetical protein
MIRVLTILLAAFLALFTGCGGTTKTVAVSPFTCSGTQPAVFLDTPSPGASELAGHTCNAPAGSAIVVWALTNQYYPQPFLDAPYTQISPSGVWATSTHPWNALVVVLVNPANYTPMATEITNPALDPNVIASTSYPPAQASFTFSGYTFGTKATGTDPSDKFDPGPNWWSPSLVSVAADGMHLKIMQVNSNWQCAEVYLTQSLGHGIYTAQIASDLSKLDQNTVAAFFIYAGPGQELDSEYSGMGGLIPPPNNAQIVAQPYTVAGNVVRYLQPSTAQFTSQIEWRADHVTFTVWKGWPSAPATSDIVAQWTYTGADIPPVGQERVRFNLWLYQGAAPVNGAGDEMIIKSFAFQP